MQEQFALHSCSRFRLYLSFTSHKVVGFVSGRLYDWREHGQSDGFEKCRFACAIDPEKEINIRDDARYLLECVRRKNEVIRLFSKIPKIYESQRADVHRDHSSRTSRNRPRSF